RRGRLHRPYTVTAKAPNVGAKRDSRRNSMSLPAMTLDFPVYDADNHFYEPDDAITRHLPARFKRELQFVTVNGRQKLAIGGKISDYIPNPTFEVVGAPGMHLKFHRGQNPEGKTLRELTGPAIKPSPAMRYGAPRLEIMDQQGIHAALV